MLYLHQFFLLTLLFSHPTEGHMSLHVSMKAFLFLFETAVLIELNKKKKTNNIRKMIHSRLKKHLNDQSPQRLAR